MSDYGPTDPRGTLPAGPVSSAKSGREVAGPSGGAGAAPPRPPESSPDRPASATPARHAGRPRVRRASNRRRGRIVAAAVTFAVVGLSAGCAASTSPTATSSSTTARQPGPGGAAGGQGPNARSGPASGGASGTVSTVSTASFTISTSAGQNVTVNEASSTTYQRGTSSIPASALTRGESVLVLGTTSGTTITATQVLVQPSDGGGSAASSAAGVIPFQRGAPTTSKQVGQIPANYTEGSGSIVSGTTANEATGAALAAYPGGVVDRVVKLSNGDYEVHYIGVNWPHHIFVDQDFKVVGAN
jgi:hypothetical protein